MSGIRAMAQINWVALHPEGVDRNFRMPLMPMRELSVALHPEGVDRNSSESLRSFFPVSSPSTRRAWIEMALSCMS